MPFIAEHMDFNGYQGKNLAAGVEGTDAVRMDQLTPIANEVQDLLASLANYVQTSQFGNLFASAAQNADLFSGSQVNAAIVAALAGLPDPAERLGGIAVKDFVMGTLAEAEALAATLGLTASDSGSIDDAAQSCLLVVSPSIAETGLYQLRTNGTLFKMNSDLFTAGLGYYTEFVAVAGATRRGRQFAVVEMVEAAEQFQVVEVPYTDEYMGLGPITVSYVDKTINFRFSAADFIVDQQGEFQLLPALKRSIEEIPEIKVDLEALTQVVQDLNDSLSNQISQLSSTVQNLSQTVDGQAQNISSLQSSLGEALSRLAQLEIDALRVSDFAKNQEIWFYQTGNGPVIGYVKDDQGQWNPAPNSLVQAIAETTNHVEVRIAHGRGVPVTPIYSYTDINGERLRSTHLYGIEAITDSSVNVLVEKDKRVKLTFPAGVKARSV